MAIYDDVIKKYIFGMPSTNSKDVTRGLLGSGGKMGSGGLLQRTFSSPAITGGLGLISAGMRGVDPQTALIKQQQLAGLQRQQERDILREGVFKNLPKDSPYRKIASSGYRDAAVAAYLRDIQDQKKAALDAAKTSTKEIKDLTKDFRNIYTKDPIVKNFNEGQTQLNKLLSGAQQNSAAGDLSMIFTYMKVLDPTSVVREGEQATASNATGVPGRIRNVYNQVLEGKKLNPEQRNDFKRTAIGLFQSNQQALDAYRQGLSNSFRAKGIKSEDVFIDADLRPKKVKIDGKIQDVPLGTKLIDYEDGFYIYKTPSGTTFKIKRKG